MDLVHKICKWVDYNRYTATAVLLLVIYGSVMYGCRPSVVSPRTGELVSRSELQRDALITASSFEKRISELVKEAEVSIEVYALANVELQEKEEAWEEALTFLTTAVGSAVPTPWGEVAVTGMGIRCRKRGWQPLRVWEVHISHAL